MATGSSVRDRNYLGRARQRLDDGTDESLVYAALELRSGITQRLREYLAAWKEVDEKKKAGWQIPQLAANIEETFKLGNKVVKLTLTNEQDGPQTRVMFYTPVTASLRKRTHLAG
jgi:hypothetical protein